LHCGGWGRPIQYGGHIKQPLAQVEVKEYTGEWVEKEMQKQQTNKEQKSENV